MPQGRLPSASLWILAVSLGLSGIGSGCRSTRPKQNPIARSIEAWSEDAFTGREITTEHFCIRSTLQDPELEAAIPEFLEACHKYYQELLPTTGGHQTRLTSYVFRRRSEWAAYTRRHYPDRYDVYSRIDSGGFTEGTKAVAFYASRSGILATLAHEGWHQYVHANIDAQLPSWLSEGLGCYFESVSLGVNGPTFRPRHNSFRLNDLRTALRQKRILSLDQLINTNVGDIIRQRGRGAAHEYYAQAWALVTFLRHGDHGRMRKAFDRMMIDLGNGDFDVLVGATVLGRTELTFADAVLPTYFSCSVEDLAESFREHLYQLAGYSSP